ncbi:MAG: hypothetical protein WC539_00840 [Nitrospirota bacterium]
MKRRFFLQSIFALFLITLICSCGAEVGGDDEEGSGLHDSFNYTSFPSGPWNLYSGSQDNWTISTSGTPTVKSAFLSVPTSTTSTQNSYFINDNYNKGVDCTVFAKMRILDAGTGTLGLLLRVTGLNGYYSLKYNVTDNQLVIHKYISSNHYSLATSPTLTGFTPASDHVYKFKISGTSPIVLTGSIDGFPSSLITYTDNGSQGGGVHLFGKPGFLFDAANSGYVTDFRVTEP